MWCKILEKNLKPSKKHRQKGGALWDANLKQASHTDISQSAAHCLGKEKPSKKHR